MLKIAWKENYCHPVPEGHKFPMEKYNLLPEQLLHEGTIEKDNIFTPRAATIDELLAIHDQTYIQHLTQLELTPRAQRKTGFTPHTKQLIQRELDIMGGTIECTNYALEYGVSFNIAGGTHHAYSTSGEGFCLLNDQAIAAQYLLNNKKANKIVIVDLDVHQGNGTAEIFKNNASVFTFSMHGENNYPLKKDHSDLDIGLDDYIKDSTYLSTLQKTLPQIINEQQPDFIFYQCGVDPLECDKLGRLSLTIEGLKQRDFFVLNTCKQNNIPVVCTMGGGYSVHLKNIIEAHSNTFRVAKELYF